MQKSRKKQANRRLPLLLLLGLLLALVLVCAVYLGSYYHALPGAMDAIQHPAESVTVTELPGKRLVFSPEDPVAGLIFYPGGKVQYEAYAPLMDACAQRGILCILVHMPCNLAVFDSNAADGLMALYPEITDWYLGGHSLGGVMASSYVSKHAADYRGLVLLASYSTADLTESGLEVLSLVGDQDRVLNREKAEEAAGNLPAGAIFAEIPGGCHAYFGCYGPQKGDGTPAISNEEQIRQTADAIAALIGY